MSDLLTITRIVGDESMASIPVLCGIFPETLPGLTSTFVPAAIACNPLVRRRFYFTLPVRLLTLVEQHLGYELVKGDCRNLELELGAMCGHHQWYAGFWDGRMIEYRDLEEPDVLSAAEANAADCVDARHQTTNPSRRLAADRIFLMNKIARGYVGWLVTNRQFVDEHDKLFGRWRHLLSHSDLGLIGRSPTWPFDGKLGQPNTARLEDLRDAQDAFLAFLARWRLHALLAPDLPSPLKPFLLGQFPIHLLEQMMRGGGLFNIPDTFPLPSRDEFRQMLSAAQGLNQNSEHLAEWHSIVRLQNSAKNQIDRYARIRTIVHYWRVLHVRYRSMLRRKSAKLRVAFSDYLGVSEETIRKDLQSIRRRLGPGWEFRDAAAPDRS
jgi:hypothetical protein